MAVELIGAAGMSAELKQTYDRLLLSVAEQNLVFSNFGEKRNIPARGGKSIEFRRFEKIVVGSGNHLLTEGTAPTETQATISTVAATISQYGAFAKVSDLLEAQGFDPIIAEYSEKFGMHMAEVVDTVVRDVLIAGTTIQYASTAATRTGASGVGSGMYLNSAELREAKKTLERQNVKAIEGNLICILHPDNTKDLYADADIVNAFQHAAPRGPGNPLLTGELGTWMGIKFVQTTNLKIWASLGLSGADVYGVLLLGKEAYAVTELNALQSRMIIHEKRLSDPMESYSTLGWKAALAAVILNQNWMVRIECNSSQTTAA